MPAFNFAEQPDPPPNHHFREQVAAEVRSQLARRRVSGRALAAALGESPTWVSRRLNGQVPFDTDDLERVAEALDITPMELLGGNPFRRAGARQVFPGRTPPDGTPAAPTQHRTVVLPWRTVTTPYLKVGTAA